MKRIIAVVLLIVAAAWAVYIYGFVRTADAQGGFQAYQPDPKLEPWVQNLETLSESMRRQIDAMDHEAKLRAETPAPAVPSTPLRNPFLQPQ